MLISAFLTYIRCELALSVHTVLSYKVDLEQWRDYATNGHPEDFRPMDMTASDLRTWLAHMSRCGISARSIRRKTQSLRSFYRYLMLRHGLKSNPAMEIILAKMPKKLPDFIRERETANVFDSFDENGGGSFEEVRDRLILLMFYSTGMRVAELIGLMDADVDIVRSELKVLGKRNKERVIPFGKELKESITRYRELRDATVGGVTEAFLYGIQASRCIICLSIGWCIKRLTVMCIPGGGVRMCYGIRLLPTCLTMGRIWWQSRSCWAMPLLLRHSYTHI